MCDRLMHDHHVPMHIHEKDAPPARHPYRYAHERPRLPYPLRHTAAIPVLARMVAADALGVNGVTVPGDRSDERSEGREGVSTCSSRSERDRTTTKERLTWQFEIRREFRLTAKTTKLIL